MADEGTGPNLYDITAWPEEARELAQQVIAQREAEAAELGRLREAIGDTDLVRLQTLREFDRQINDPDDEARKAAWERVFHESGLVPPGMSVDDAAALLYGSLQPPTPDGDAYRSPYQEEGQLQLPDDVARKDDVQTAISEALAEQQAQRDVMDLQQQIAGLGISDGAQRAVLSTVLDRMAAGEVTPANFPSIAQETYRAYFLEPAEVLAAEMLKRKNAGPTAPGEGGAPGSGDDIKVTNFKSMEAAIRRKLGIVDDE